MKPDPATFRRALLGALSSIRHHHPLYFDDGNPDGFSWLVGQGLAGVVASCADELGVCGKLAQRLDEQHRAYTAQWLSWQTGWQQALAALDNPLVLKGAALCPWLYPEPGLRPVGDLDVLIAPESRQAAGSALAALGFEAQLAVDGELIMTQQRFSRPLSAGLYCHIDLHWQSSNRAVLADALPLKLLRQHVVTDAIGLPSAARLTPAAALLHAAVHLIGHHADEMQLKWLLDIHLIWTLGDKTLRNAAADLAMTRELAPVLSQVLGLCASTLGTRHTETARAHLLAGNRQRSRHLTQRGPQVIQDLRALPDSHQRLRYLSQLLFPSRQYMEARGFGSGPMAYVRRLLGAFVKRLRRINH